VAEAPEPPEPVVAQKSDGEWIYPPGAFPPDPAIELTAVTVRELEASRGSPAAIRVALCRYFKRGLAASFDHEELVDLLCASNDLLGEAGYARAEVEKILSEVLPALSDEEIASTKLD
jgi:hypothetical protein